MENIYPIELREQANWVVRKKKIPYNPLTNKMARAGDPTTWATYDEASLATFLYDYDGVGFELDGNSTVFIDLDHCIDCTTGEVHPNAREIIESFSSYTETSISGTGVHILVNGDIPSDGRKATKEKLGFPAEIYKNKRYVALTGNVFEGKNSYIKNQEALTKLYSTLFGEPNHTIQNLPLGKAKEGWLEDALSKDAELKALYKGRRDNDDESSCDFKLMIYLLPWASYDTNSVITAFISSPYAESKDHDHTKKMERTDYLKMTAKKALDALRETEFCESEEKDIDAPWELPQLFALPPPPEFNPDWLPEGLQQYCKELALSLQVPIDFVGIGILSILSICNARVYRIQGKSDHKEPLNLMCVIVAEPSERKSAVLKNLMEPIVNHETTINEFLHNDIAVYDNKKKIMERDLQVLQSKAGSDTNKNKEAKEKAIQLSELQPVYRKRFYVNDVTPEKVVTIMAEQGGRIAVIGAEGGFLDLINGQYSKNPSFDFLLQGYSGETIIADRIGRENTEIKNGAISMLLMVQPCVVESMVSNEKFMGKGLLSRMIISYPESMLGSRTYEVPPVSEKAMSKYNNTIMELISRTPDNLGLIKLSKEAFKEYTAYFEQIEKRLRCDLEPLNGLGGKLHGMALRIAGNLHIADNHTNPNVMPVSLANLKKAIAITEYFIGHAWRAYGLSKYSDFKECLYVVSRIKVYKKKNNINTSITKRELTRSCQAIKESKRLDVIIDQLIAFDYLRPIVYNPAKGRPSKNFAINPYIIDAQEDELCSFTN